MKDRPLALDLFAGAGGVSWGLFLAGFDVVAVDHEPMPHHPAHHAAEYARHFTFHRADALTFDLSGYDFITASPPCQAHSSLRHLTKGKVYPEPIEPTRDRLKASGTPYCIENVPGAPLGDGIPLLMLCGTMLGLQTPDGRAELRRHRWFETSWPIGLRPQCQHGHVSGESLSVTGSGLDSNQERWAQRTTLSVVGKKGLPGLSHERRKVLTVTGHSAVENKRVICVAGGKAMAGGMMTPQGELKRRALSITGHAVEIRPSNWNRRAISVTGNTPQTNTVRNTKRETFSVHDARAAMGIPWMPMKYLSQAIPPAYSLWIAERALEEIAYSKGDRDSLRPGPARPTSPTPTPVSRRTG